LWSACAPTPRAPTLPFDPLTYPSDRGRYVNFLYSLLDEDGELHPPKDSERREIELMSEDEAALRQQVLKDVKTMATKKFPLSAGFYRQLGEVEKAAQVEAAMAKNQTVMDHLSQMHPIDCVVEELETLDRPVYLVRWEGYAPAWEPWRCTGQVGDPIETWEPRSALIGTAALLAWEGDGVT